MEFGLSQEQEFLRDTLTRFLADNAGLPRARRFADGDERRAQDLWDGLVALGVPGLVIPEAHGGVGLTTLDAATVAQTLGAAIAPVPFIGTAILVPRALIKAGSADQQAEWLPRIAAGETIVGVAVSEAASGAREGAKVTASAGRLSGKTLFVLDFEADAYLVADDRRRLYLVDANAKGLTRRDLRTIDATRRVGELVLDGVAAQLLPASEDAAVLADVLDVGRVLLAADTFGAAQNMLDQAVAYSLTREQFNRPIGSFQAVKHMCAEMAAELEPCQSLVWYAAHAVDAIPGEARVTACHAKAHVAEAGKFVAKTATEVHGGMGFTDLLGLHYWFKRIGLNRQLLGSPERLREEAARVQALIE
ncbi:MAG TPA: acyl-CoA dehydrogenase family protein [Pseudomonadales bacterium]|nr:acyl-CoA dehydrogenase family protein [Pseudomonadales bacterium]